MRNGNQRAVEMSYIEKFWRDATAADVTRVMAGETVEARFRDNESKPWDEGEYLGGWLEGRWKKAGGGSWNYCQVYSPPQWFLDKPEPGEGYRLLGKFPGEPRQPKDDVFVDGAWLTTEGGGAQPETLWYRRKIEQPKPEPKFAVGQRVKIVGPPAKGARAICNWSSEMDKYIGGVADVVSVSSMVGDKVFYDLRFIEQWAFREDYLEPVVEPKHYVLQVGDTAGTGNGFRITITEHGVEVT
jgi:hypothetical protein